MAVRYVYHSCDLCCLSEMAPNDLLSHRRKVLLKQRRRVDVGRDKECSYCCGNADGKLAMKHVRL